MTAAMTKHGSLDAWLDKHMYFAGTVVMEHHMVGGCMAQPAREPALAACSLHSTPCLLCRLSTASRQVFNERVQESCQYKSLQSTKVLMHCMVVTLNDCAINVRQRNVLMHVTVAPILSRPLLRQ